MLVKKNLVASNKANRSVPGSMSLLGASIELDYLALNDASPAVYIEFGSALPPGAIFQGSRVQVITPFENLAADLDLELQLGIANDGIEYGDFIESLNTAGNYFGSDGAVAPTPKFAGAITPVASFLAVDGITNLEDLVRGRAIVNIYYLILPNVR